MVVCPNRGKQHEVDAEAQQQDRHRQAHRAAADDHDNLGAALLCIEGDEIVRSMLDAMAADASYHAIRRCVHIHPTVSELIPTLLDGLVPLR